MTAVALIHLLIADAEAYAERGGSLAGPVLPEQRSASRTIDLLENLRQQLKLEELPR